ncbi:MAG: HD domain-containing protein [Gilvibacter sp.]
MSTRKKLTLFNDPIYGFITIPSPLIFELIEHSYFQRLRRITQMGMSYIVFPGAHHTRFHHAIGCMYLMQKAVQVLRFKDISILPEEEEALYAAILLHDIGHGPFSHALEHSIVDGVHHEDISLLFMQELNTNFNDRLTLAIQIFSDKYHKKFLHQLVSGQLDMDRLDYLRRDSFYTGVSEGNINTERLITMLNVHEDTLVVESKGIYSVEKFIVARRLMYWSVYLHKTSLVAEQMLLNLLKRAKELYLKGIEIKASPSLLYFFDNPNKAFDGEALKMFARLDDYDIIQAVKLWCDHDDIVINRLSNMIIDRSLLKIKIREKPFKSSTLQKKRAKVMKHFGISEEEAAYFVINGAISNQAYSTEKENINMLSKSGKLVDVAKASDQLNIEALSNLVSKHYLCYPKGKHY